jgi:hypothetical protein
MRNVRRLTPVQKAVNVYCALVLLTSAIVLALFGPVLASVMIIFSICTAGLLAAFVWVFLANRQYMEDSNVQVFSRKS